MAARLGLREVVALHDAAHAHFLRRVDEHTQHIGPVAQNKVRAAADHHTALVLRQAQHHLGLVAEQVLVGNKVVAVRRDDLAVVGVLGHAEQQTAAEAFLRVGKQLFVDAAVIGGHAQDIPIVKRDAQAPGQRLADGAAVASVFPGDGDHVIFHNVPSLKQQLFSLSV